MLLSGPLTECSAGFSGVLFALKVVLQDMDGGMVRYLGVIPLPAPDRLAYWAEPIILTFLMPNVSWMGHLAGIVAGVLWVMGPLQLIAQVPAMAVVYFGPRPRRYDDEVRTLSHGAAAAAAATATPTTAAAAPAAGRDGDGVRRGGGGGSGGGDEHGALMVLTSPGGEAGGAGVTSLAVDPSAARHARLARMDPQRSEPFHKERAASKPAPRFRGGGTASTTGAGAGAGAGTTTAAPSLTADQMREARLARLKRSEPKPATRLAASASTRVPRFRGGGVLGTK